MAKATIGTDEVPPEVEAEFEAWLDEYAAMYERKLREALKAEQEGDVTESTGSPGDPGSGEFPGEEGEPEPA